MIAPSGAIGVALVGGGPLVAIGKVHELDEALVAALAGVCLAVRQVSRTLVPPVTPAARGPRERADASPRRPAASPCGRRERPPRARGRAVAFLTVTAGVQEGGKS